MLRGGFNDTAQETWDFVRCQRPDGTFYGTSGTCRKGSPAAAKLAKLPKEKLQKLAQDPRLKPDQKKMVDEAIRNAGDVSKPTKTSDPKKTQQELIAKQKQLVKEGKLDEALKMSKEIGKATAAIEDAKPKAAKKEVGKKDDLAAQKKIVDDLRKQVNNAKSSQEEEEAFKKYKAAEAKYNKMKEAQPLKGKEDEISKKQKEIDKHKADYEKYLAKNDFQKATESYQKAAKASKEMDDLKGITKKRQEEKEAQRLKEEESDPTLKKINDRQRAANLTPDQKQALADYSSDGRRTEKGEIFGFRQLNDCFRNPSRCPDNEEAKTFTKQLDSALKALPKNDDGDAFYRGISVGNVGPTVKLYETLANARPGTIFKDPGYGSYSLNKEIAEGFQTGNRGRAIMFVSRSKKLTPMNMFSQLRDEKEAVLPRGVEQTIRKVTKQGDMLIIEVD